MGGGEEERERKRKRKKGEEKVERVAIPSLYISRLSDRRLGSEQEAKFFLAARASSRDQNRGVSKNSVM